MLSHRYYSQTNDWNFIRSIKNSITAAAKWIDTYADLDNDGYIESHLQAPVYLFRAGKIPPTP